MKAVEVSLGAPVEEATVLSPNFLAKLSSVVDEAHEALNPEGGGCDGEGGHLCSGKEKINAARVGMKTGRVQKQNCFNHEIFDLRILKKTTATIPW